MRERVGGRKGLFSSTRRPSRHSQPVLSMPTGCAKELAEHREDLLGGDDREAEGQVSRCLDVTAHPDMSAAMRLVQKAADSVDRRWLVVTPRLRRGERELLAAVAVAGALSSYLRVQTRPCGWNFLSKIMRRNSLQVYYKNRGKGVDKSAISCYFNAQSF